MLFSPPSSPDRRRGRRYPVGFTVRVRIEGISDPSAAELSDVSENGCFLRGEEVSFLTGPGERLAFGFVLPSNRVVLVRGRVVRRSPGSGLGVVIEQANDPFGELIGSLADQGAPPSF